MTADAIDWALFSAQGGLTIDDLPDEHLVGVRMELIDGSLIVTLLGDLENQGLVTEYAALLRDEKLPDGCLALAGVNVMRGERTIVIPDVAVVDPSFSEHRGLGVSPEGLLFAVEISSPSTRVHDLTTKRELYGSWGVPYLVVDRSTRPPTSRVHGALPDYAQVLLAG